MAKKEQTGKFEQEEEKATGKKDGIGRPAAAPAPSPKPPEEKKSMEEYNGEIVNLTQEQMLGQGGGVQFFEILDSSGRSRVHIALPALLRDRPAVKKALRKHADSALKMRDIFMSVDLSDKKSEKEIERLEKQDEDALLTIAFFCFKRSDSTLDGKNEKAGKEEIVKWIDEGQLTQISEVAMGLNKLRPPMGPSL